MKVLAHQNLLDIALQECGDARAAFNLAVANNLSITDDLIVGAELNIMNYEFKNIDIMNYYKKRSITPATAEPMSLDSSFAGFPLMLPFILP